MKQKITSINLPRGMITALKERGGTLGEALDDVLSCVVSDTGTVDASALARELGTYAASPAIDKERMGVLVGTSVYGVPTKLNGLRAYAKDTYFHFDSLVRVLIHNSLTCQSPAQPL